MDSGDADSRPRRSTRNTKTSMLETVDVVSESSAVIAGKEPANEFSLPHPLHEEPMVFGVRHGAGENYGDAPFNDMMKGFRTEMERAIQQAVNAAVDAAPRRDMPGPSQSSRDTHRRRMTNFPLGSSSEDETAGMARFRGHNSNHGSKLPPFTGKEKWKVWFNRFSDIARLRRWNEQEKLNELLPRLQGAAGEFVYEQLSYTIRTDYQALVDEINNRFRVVETKKTFGVQFSNRTQKPGESVEEFAAELKRLYDKAHSNRDLETRQEDLLRRFLDGLSDERTRFQVEYVKEPDNIDQAVFEVVNFQETKRRPNGKEHETPNRPKRPTRRVQDDDEQCDSSNELDDETEDRIARVPTRASKNKPIANATGQMAQLNSQTEGKNGPEANGSNAVTSNDLKQLRETMEKINLSVDNLSQRVQVLETKRNQPRPNNRAPGNPRNNDRQRVPNSQNQAPAQNQNFSKTVSFECFKCGQEGHYARNCPTLPVFSGQMHMAVQPNYQSHTPETTSMQTNPGLVQNPTPTSTARSATTAEGNSGHNRQTN